ncbi:phosphotransferase [Salinivibrio kushneri]|uniref:Phosphotransferase n=1 Tax=Salinivibrio kushneri TaxID=1908198 RepID=A0AA47KNJ7_9GAMM|nr:phosphotransferase [Salinivibrio kushneri]WBA09927.1 phosphotransferase [Salinivibrio kushneri]
MSDGSSALDAPINTALSRFYAKPTEITHTEPLAAGLTNRCWRITDSHGGKSVWRPNSQAVRAFDIDRSREATAQSLAANYGLAPQPIALLAEGLLVPWVPGQPLDQCNDDYTAILIDLLVRIHQLPVEVENASVEAQCQHYERQLSAANMRHLEDIKAWVIAQRPAERGDIPVVCHMDLGAYNVVMTPSRDAVVLDWEYARTADAHLDIALFCRANGLQPDKVIEAYCAKQQIKTIEAVRKRVLAWLPFADYLALCWYEVGAKLYRLPAYKEAANQLFEQLAAQRRG